MIIIIGAGICGLATAYELLRRGERAIVVERGEPFSEQSVGLARIFRIAHQRPALCDLAMRARAGWQRWETELGWGDYWARRASSPPVTKRIPLRQ